MSRRKKTATKLEKLEAELKQELAPIFLALGIEFSVEAALELAGDRRLSDRAERKLRAWQRIKLGIKFKKSEDGTLVADGRKGPPIAVPRVANKEPVQNLWRPSEQLDTGLGLPLDVPFGDDPHGLE